MYILRVMYKSVYQNIYGNILFSCDKTQLNCGRQTSRTQDIWESGRGREEPEFIIRCVVGEVGPKRNELHSHRLMELNSLRWDCCIVGHSLQENPGFLSCFTFKFSIPGLDIVSTNFNSFLSLLYADLSFFIKRFFLHYFRLRSFSLILGLFPLRSAMILSFKLMSANSNITFWVIFINSTFRRGS